MRKTISCKELYHLMTEGIHMVIIDVLPPELYASRHIPGAQNACVYEMTFEEHVLALCSDRARKLVLYDSSDRSQASTFAADKLANLGFLDTVELRGGFEEWEGSGYPVDVLGPEIDDEPTLADGTYTLDCAASRLEWCGRSIFKKHTGSVAIADGTLRAEDGIITGGSITIDMNSIRNDDLQDPDENSLLIRHLKSSDFFHVTHFPTASFHLMESGPLVGATPGSPNYFIKGKLTIRDISKEIAVPATIVPAADGSLRAQACFDIDRTEWNVKYGSGKLFEKLGMHLVNDTISLELYITAT